MLQANGFFGAKGISGRIPEGYTHLEQRFWNSIVASNRQWQNNHGVQLHEWSRDGWTYHAKGLWVSPSLGELPVLTLFGSSNLNSRSANLDTELSFVMVIPEDDKCKSIKQDLAEELARLRKFAVQWQGNDRNVRITTKWLVSLVGGML